MTGNDLIHDLQKPWRHGEHVDARDVVIDQPMRLDGMALRSFDLSGAHFKSGLSARGATFLGLAWLRDVKIEGILDLTGAQFRIDLRAEGIRSEMIRIDQVEVRGVLALARVQAHDVSLTDALIMANLTLEGAQLSGGIDLSGTEVMGGFWADGANLGQVSAQGFELHGRQRNAPQA